MASNDAEKVKKAQEAYDNAKKDDPNERSSDTRTLKASLDAAKATLKGKTGKDNNSWGILG